jgi:hypothetical protein
MSKSAKSPSSKPPGAGDSIVEVAVVGNGESNSTYAMFEAQELTAEGAFLHGEVFLEVDEEFAVRFSLGDDSVYATAKVVSLDHNKPGMNVSFAMNDEDKKKLTSTLAAAKSNS